MSYFRRLGAAVLGRDASKGSAGAYRGPAGAYDAATKASAVGAMIARLVLGQPVWPKRDQERLAREGYQQNPVVARAVDLIAGGVAGIRLDLVRGKGGAQDTLDAHPLLELLANPNPEQDGTALLHAFVAHLVITGNGYLERTLEPGNVARLDRMELYALRPDRVRVVPGPDGFLAGHEYHVGGARKRFIARPERGLRPILHLKRFHPTDDWYGLSALDPAAWAIDTHSAASAHNKALLENGATPTGAFVYTGNEAMGGAMPPDMYERLNQVLEEQVQGAANAGKPLLLEGGIDWKQFGLNLEDMQFVESKALAAREIAFALGVPPLLMGLPGDNTYANYAEANRAFYRQTVIPYVEWIARALTQWFRPVLEGDLRLVPDLDNIPALEIEREQLWRKLDAATFLSPNEKREAVGYDHVEGGDQVMVAAGLLPLGLDAAITGDPAPEPPPAADDEGTDLPPAEPVPGNGLKLIRGRRA